nr:hypothetical protein [candidate division KSB1 bacterium]NIV70395.1 hypothetical protein [Phycisphaerae bacterium]NIU25625.1 hypothetical protein [candidate division KSB1 bacterium]NIU93232.1 hypothetical protein [candidate division KSB1 bacterium]NIW19476.1 hypothetical protein [candidate division KSB1 bacterium]
MTKLSVNLNKFALLRNAREMNFPNIIDIELAKAIGADRIILSRVLMPVHLEAGRPTR